MAMELRIHFTGLILFAPDPSPPDAVPCLHAVLLRHGAGSEVHLSRLVYDSAYEREGDGDLNGHLRCAELRDTVLRVGAGFGSRIDPQNGFGNPGGRLPDQVVNLDDIAGVGPLSRAFVEAVPAPRIVGARVTICVGRFDRHFPGAHWKIPGKDRRPITPLVQWNIRDPHADRVTLELKDLSPEGEPHVRSLTLFPRVKEGGQVVEVWVYNAPSRELPPPDDITPPTPGTAAEHFHAYYDPFAPGTGPIPILDQESDEVPPPGVTSDCKPSVAPPGGTIGHALDIRTAHTATCVTAQAPL